MKFWIFDVVGLILIGGACSAAVMIYAGDKMPTGLLLIVMFVASALGGMIWGMIPAVFKAHWNTNETLFTLMINYVAMQVITYCIVFWENPKGSNTVGIINQATKAGWLPELFGQKYGWNVVIVLVLTVGKWRTSRVPYRKSLFASQRRGFWIIIDSLWLKQFNFRVSVGFGRQMVGNSTSADFCDPFCRNAALLQFRNDKVRS